MKTSIVIGAIAVGAAATLSVPPFAALAQTAPAAATAAKPPPTRGHATVSIPSAAVLVHQPQVNKWEANQIDFVRWSRSCRPAPRKRPSA